MKVRHVYNVTWLERLNIRAITLYPFIFFAEPEEQVSDRLMAHEMEHVSQVMRYGWFCFYLSYLAYYLAGLMRFKSHELAYFEIPYEVEARLAELGATARREAT